MRARSVSEVRFRIRQRFGPWLEDQAIVRLGFDWSEPLACAMVSQAMAHLLMLAAEDPTSSLAEGLDFHIEQRFASSCYESGKRSPKAQGQQFRSPPFTVRSAARNVFGQHHVFLISTERRVGKEVVSPL